MPDAAPLTRKAASDAVEDAGWRLLLGAFAASVAVDGLRDALDVAAAVVDASGPGAEEHLRVDVRADRVELVLQERSSGRVTARDAELAVAISARLAGSGHAIAAPSAPRPVQMLEFAIDALDVPTIRPFWQAVLGYVDDPAMAGRPDAALVDPAGQLPALWFQQMDEPRPQRNRIHFDITVAHDEAPRRLQAALDGGGVLVSDAEARSFWILADAEGNEICVCTWQDRD